MNASLALARLRELRVPAVTTADASAVLDVATGAATQIPASARLITAHDHAAACALRATDELLRALTTSSSTHPFTTDNERPIPAPSPSDQDPSF